MQLMGSLAKLTYLLTCSGRFSDNFTRISIIDNQNLRDGNKEESSISVVGATVDDVRIGRFRFRLDS